MHGVDELDRLLAVSNAVLLRQTLLCGGLPASGLPATQRLFTTHRKVRKICCCPAQSCRQGC